MKISIVIPCYNESKNIPLILKRFGEVIGKNKNIEVILVNNGSKDDTADVLASLLPIYPFAKDVFVSENQGYGYGILQGLKMADGDYIGWTHADMQTDPADVIKAWKIIHKYKDKKVYVKGSRQGRPFVDRFFTKSMSIFESLYFRMPMEDINAQPNLFPKEFFLMWENPPHDFSLDLFSVYMAKQTGLKVIRFPVQFPERVFGESKWNTGLNGKWKFIKRTFGYSIELKHRIGEKDQKK